MAEQVLPCFQLHWPDLTAFAVPSTLPAWKPFVYHPILGGYPDLYNHLLGRTTHMTEPENSCSFCGQPKSKVEKLVAGQDGANICNRCVALCYDVLRQEGVDISSWRRAEQPPGPERNT